VILSEVSLPVPYAECKHLALVYPYDVAVLWYVIQQQHGDPRHVAEARPLTDGRWILDGDLLAELHPAGILGWALPHLTHEIMSAIEVVPMIEVAPLLPPPPPFP
jgi:hypothetical protein